jgi:hypothetical protein
LHSKGTRTFVFYRIALPRRLDGSGNIRSRTNA